MPGANKPKEHIPCYNITYSQEVVCVALYPPFGFTIHNYFNSVCSILCGTISTCNCYCVCTVQWLSVLVWSLSFMSLYIVVCQGHLFLCPHSFLSVLAYKLWYCCVPCADAYYLRSVFTLLLSVCWLFNRLTTQTLRSSWTLPRSVYITVFINHKIYSYVKLFIKRENLRKDFQLVPDFLEFSLSLSPNFILYNKKDFLP